MILRVKARALEFSKPVKEAVDGPPLSGSGHPALPKHSMEFPLGAWDYEPDYMRLKLTVESIDEKVLPREFNAEIQRNFWGALCGYISIPQDIVYATIGICDLLKTHGGITYTEETIGCGVKVGFDCAHFTDLVPGMLAYQSTAQPSFEIHQQTYRDIFWVRDELCSLAAQCYEFKYGENLV